MMTMIAALIISFVPSILMFLFLRNNRKDDREYRRNCSRLLFKGLAICALVFLFDLLLEIPWGLTGIGEKHPMIDRLFTCFLVNAFVEEICKFLTARKTIRSDTDRVSRLDIISYMTIAAISFGLLEDVVYMFGTGIGQIIVRGVLMGHVPYAMVMGLFYGKAAAENKPVYKVLAILVPVLLHGTYNFCLTDGMPDITAFIVVTEVLAETVFMIFMIFFIKKKRNDPVYTCPVFK